MIIIGNRLIKHLQYMMKHNLYHALLAALLIMPASPVSAQQTRHELRAGLAIGVDPHGSGDHIDLSGLRYGKIAILSDADVDGAHIQVLLLTLFFKHFPQLIAHGSI